jgi:hypothetical protein
MAAMSAASFAWPASDSERNGTGREREECHKQPEVRQATLATVVERQQTGSADPRPTKPPPASGKERQQEYLQNK